MNSETFLLTILASFLAMSIYGFISLIRSQIRFKKHINLNLKKIFEEDIFSPKISELNIKNINTVRCGRNGSLEQLLEETKILSLDLICSSKITKIILCLEKSMKDFNPNPLEIESSMLFMKYYTKKLKTML
jgi:hypothetical protein